MTHFSQPSFLSGPPQPLVLTLDHQGRTPLDLYRQIATPSQPSFLLDSGKGTGAGGRYSFLGSGPASVLTGRQGHSTHRTSDGQEQRGADPFQRLCRLMTDERMATCPHLPPFCGGAVGYLSYDLVRQFETLPSIAQDDLALPDVQFAFYDLVTAVDHQSGRAQIIYCPPLTRFLGEPREKLYREGLDRLAECEARLTGPAVSNPDCPLIDHAGFRPGQTREAYLERVRRCQEYIAAGDIYQANLSHRFTVDVRNTLAGMDRLAYEQALYHQLRAVNPSPFSGLLHFDDVTVISCSPERLVRLTGRQADTRPIAGTRPRGADARDDHRLVGDLLASEKERAEHLMLVDLERNDLGRVCEFGTVKVDEFMTVEQYSHVSHIVSNVSGTLRQDATPFDLIKAMFPGGTITGVPKIRCMEIIETLEPVRRGLYTGSFGYLGWNGDLDLNIVIRTLVLHGGKGYLQVGAGIVADSDPVKEYEETLHKAQAFFSALQQT
jgi:para-aminobenzoate synthetase component I